MAERRDQLRGGYLSVFRNGNFSLLWTSSLSSQLGDHLNLMALAALIFSITDGAIRGFEFSKILLLASVPVLIFSPIAGVYADRHDRKTLMIWSDLVRAALVAAIPLVATTMTPVYVVVFLVFTINRFYLSAKTAAIPQIVTDEKLMPANALLNVAMMASLILGPWGGGLLVERYGAAVGFWTDAGTYALSAGLVGFLTLRSVAEVSAERRARKERGPRRGRRGAAAPPRDVPEGERLEPAPATDVDVDAIRSAYGRLLDDLRDGLNEMRGRREVLYSTASMSAVMFLAGLVLIVCPVFVRNEFGMGAADLGMLYSVGGLGMLLGSLLVGRYLCTVPRRAIVSLSFLFAGAAVLVMAFSDSIQMLGGLVFATGFVVAPTMVACDTMIQEGMKAGSIGKAFGMREMVSKAAFGIAGILSGLIADASGPRQVLVGAGIGCLAYSAISIVLLADTRRFNALNAYPLMRAGSALASQLPRGVTYPIASFLGLVGYALLPHRRRTARRNAARVLGVDASSDEARRTARRMFVSHGLYWADFFALNGRLGRRLSDATTIDGLEHLQAAVDRGRGVVFATAHLGSWDVGGTALAGVESLGPLSAIVEPVVTEESEEKMKEMRSRRGLNVIPLGRPLKLGRALRRGETVFFVADRTIGGEGIEIEFFSRPAVFPKGPAYWAIKSGAAVVPGFCVRDGGRFICYVEPAIEFDVTGDDDADMERLTRSIVAAFEKYIGRYPSQWCMLQPIWPEEEDSA
ncbi:MAG: MFS transporter [Candidatus Eisenbacteria bacterium]|nr:MFS transporter [Candidatus Eisenbacteria bacterium]